MINSTTLTTKQPENWFNQKVEIDFKKIFTSISKGVINTFTGNVFDLSKDLSDGFEAISNKQEPESLAYTLLVKAMINSALILTIENRSILEKKYKVLLEKDPDFNDFSIEMKEIAKDITINSDFFKNPKNISVLPEFIESYRRFLQYFEVENYNIQNIINRLPSYFIMSLNEEWRKNNKLYDVILNNLDTPFTEAAKREAEWQSYYSFLEKQINEPVFEETFGLKQIYIPLRGYYKKKNDKKENNEIHENEHQTELIPFYVEEELNKWLYTIDCSRTIKLISGGPGSGKSTLSKIWSANIAELYKLRILFIPLHLFDIQGDIQESVEKFVKQNTDINFSFNPMKLDEKLLIVFDGLDELSQQGKYAAEVASNFIDSLQKYSDLKNRENAVKTLFLLTGRELAIQANSNHFRKFDQTVFLLPYYIYNKKNTSVHKTNKVLNFSEEYKDIIDIDQRNLWWEKFGQLKNKQYSALPTELKLPRLDEITSQPLLNYLVTLSYERGKVIFNNNTNLNDVYKDLIEGVHERAYEARTHKQVDGLSKEHFIRILQEIAISAWHGGDSRTTSIREIEEHIEQNHLKPLMDMFQEEAKTGILRLLTAFYFREHGVTNNGDRTFEFTHKSFGEYLIATRLVHQLSQTSKKLEEKNEMIDEGWSESEALTKWMSITRQTAIDEYLFEFIKDEIKSKNLMEVNLWQKNLAKLLSFMLHNGMPMPEPRESHKKEVVKVRNASEALLAFHSACAYYTDRISQVNVPQRITFSIWLRSLQPQRSGPNNTLGISCLNHLNLSNYIFDIADLYGAKLSKSILSNSKLYSANLEFADLQGINLQNANLYNADFEGANLERANLKEANLKESNLRRANLKGANLERANLEGANLEGANLKEANLEGANLKEANLKGVKGISSTIKNRTLKVK